MQEKKFNKKYILIATVIIATTCIVSTTIMMSLNKQNKYHSYIKKADSALSRNRYDEAINLYKKAKEFSKEDTLIDNSIKLASIMKEQAEEEEKKAKEAREQQIKQREEERLAYEKQLEKEQQEKKKVEENKKSESNNKDKDDEEKGGIAKGVEKFFKSIFGK